MREIVWDTETTGLDPQNGDRIVEIGAVELNNQMPTGRVYHQYINPECPMPQSAFEIHGLGDDFLKDKPIFSAIAQDFLNFIGDANVVAHNAEFDMRFINTELEQAGFNPISASRSVDTLAIARKRFPGAQNSLDALCRRFEIDNSAREKHGALLDSEILAEVYLELLGGRQPDFSLNTSVTRKPNVQTNESMSYQITPRPKPLKPRLTQGEADAHHAFIESLGTPALWTKLG